MPLGLRVQSNLNGCASPSTDLAAIPDFVSGAMEHWGLVTFREMNLLYEQGISSTVNKMRVAMVIGHELAHMWFGNLSKLKFTLRMKISSGNNS